MQSDCRDGFQHDEALACAAAGLPVFPFHGVTDGVCDCGFEHHEKAVGNHPCLSQSNVSATTSAQQISDWFRQRPNSNYAIAAGKEIGSSGHKLAILETGVGDSASATVIAMLQKTEVIHTVLGESVAPDGMRHLYISVPLTESFETAKPLRLTIKQVPFALAPGSVYSSGEKVVWLRKFFVGLQPTDVVHNCETAREGTGEAAAGIEAPNVEVVAIPAEISTPAMPEAAALALSCVSTASDTVLRIQKTREAAVSYAEHAFKLCAIAKGGKAPKDMAWQHNPIDPAKTGDHGLGIIHALSNTCAIDFDDLKNAQAWFANKGIDVNDLLHADDAVQINSGRSNRAKLLFRLPSSVTLLNTFKIKNPDGSMMIEFRCANDGGSGCQDVLPPSVHPDTGKPYEWAGAGDYQNLPTLPEPLLALWLSQTQRIMPREKREAQVERQASAESRFMEGGRNDALYKLGGDLAGAKLSRGGIEAALLTENQQRCVPPLPESEVRQIATSASKGSRGAKEAASGEVLEFARDELLKQTSLALKTAAATNAAHAPAYANLPPVMKAIVEWSQATARTAQPAFALCTALAACSSVLSRDFTGAAGAHTNLYCVAVGPTGCGKENTIDAVVQVINAYDPARLAGVPASDTGVLTAVQRDPASVFVIDEIGEVLKSVFDPKAASHTARIGTVFMELYTKGGKPYRGKEYANQSADNGKPRVDIFSPCPSIFGATTATTLYNAMTSDVVSSGFLPRMLVFRAPDTIPMPNLDYAEAPLPVMVTDWVTAIHARVEQEAAEATKNANLKGVANSGYRPVTVPYSDEATALFRAAQVSIVERRNATVDALDSNMMSRVVENAGRVALTLALAENPWATEVSAECFMRGMEIVQKSTAAFIADIRANLFDSVHAKLETAVVHKVSEYFVSNKGKPISDGLLADRCRPYGSAHPQQRKAVIEALVRQGKVTTSPGRNKNTLLYTPSFEAQQ